MLEADAPLEERSLRRVVCEWSVGLGHMDRPIANRYSPSGARTLKHYALSDAS